MEIPRDIIPLDANVWGRHYWFFLHTIAFKYTNHPNAVTKRKYYDLITNFPIFIPDEEMGNYFAELLDRYPVTPYLDNRESFIRWVWFIHNKMNGFLKKEEMELFESLDKYLEQFNSHSKKRMGEQIFLFMQKYLVVIILLSCLLLFIVYKKNK